MSSSVFTTAIAAAIAVLATPPGAWAQPAPAEPAKAAPSPEAAELLTYLRRQHSTGFIVIQDGRLVLHQAWPAPQGDPIFANFVYGQTAKGALLEDVASQQKSFVAILLGVAVDKGLLDVDAPVSKYLGDGWSKASREQEARIRVIDVMTMSSGLDERFTFVAPPGTRFFYNTAVYAITKQILTAAAGQPLDVVTRDWLTAPLGMADTCWRRRPGALASVGNATGLVTTPQDVARFGLMVLNDGVAEDGTRVISHDQLQALFTRSATNPAYGRLWWLNGGDHVVRAQGQQIQGSLVPAAPSDMVGAYGALDRRLYVVPSRKLVVVRTGAAAEDRNFDQELWLRLMKVLG